MRRWRPVPWWVAAIGGGVFGGDLLSHLVSRAVPSALTGLASGFGMEPGVSPSLWPPKLCRVVWCGMMWACPDRFSGTA